MVTLSVLLEEGSSDSGAGPVVPCRGTEWVVTAGRTYRVVDRVYPGYGIARAQPMHISYVQPVPNSAKQAK